MTNSKGSDKTLFVITGPTAVGKTALSIQLAEYFKTEIISADARQFYKELNIGVARPNNDELKKVRHHFIACISITEEFSAGKFESEALALTNNLLSVHDHVICSGGSTLYIEALINGLDPMPANPELRTALTKEFESIGIDDLRKKLIALDPEYSSEADLSNPHRIIRALEICILTGQKYSSLRKRSSASRPFNIVQIGLNAEREKLYSRIDHRVDQMIQAGLEEEVRSLIPYKHLNALNTVGYKEFFDFFEGLTDRKTAIEKIKQHSRNYAKRQLTWWRKNPSIHWIDVLTGDPFKKILAHIGHE